MKKIMCLMLLAIIGLMILGGCQTSEESKIKTQEEATEAVTDVSEDIEELANTMEDIESDLG